MKKIAIVCDNYKVSRYESQLKTIDYPYMITNGVTKDTKLITVFCAEHQVSDLKQLCEKTESYFNAKKN